MANNLLTRLLRRAFPLVTASAMALGSISGCADKSTEPNQSNQDPVVNISNFSFGEDEPYTLNLEGKITSPKCNFGNLKITATSPDLNITLNGMVASITNKIPDWNGPTYSDWTVECLDHGRTTKRIDVTVEPRTDIIGYLEDVYTGARISGVPIIYQTKTFSPDANGQFKFQVPTSNDTLKINSGQYYNFRRLINANGKDINLNNLQLVLRYTDPITGADLCEFMNTYMLPGRWSNSNLPVKVFIGNPPSPEYGEAVTQGIMSWGPVVNQWLPEGRKLNLFQIVSSDPEVGIRVDYTSTDVGDFGFIENFRKGVIHMNPIQVGDARKITGGHEGGHGLYGINPAPFDHSPYPNHIMYKAFPLPYPAAEFEGKVVAVKYTLNEGAAGDCSN